MAPPPAPPPLPHPLPLPLEQGPEPALPELRVQVPELPELARD